MRNVNCFRDVCQEMIDLFERKNADYGDSFSRIYQKFGLLSTVIRLSDKVGRLETLCKREARVKEESIRDTLMDIATYAIMTIVEIDNILQADELQKKIEEWAQGDDGALPITSKAKSAFEAAQVGGFYRA